LPATTDERVVV